LEQRIIKDLPLPILFAPTFGPLVDICRDHILKFITLDDALLERILEACWDAVRRRPSAERRAKVAAPVDFTNMTSPGGRSDA
jgi:hypothetical protein